VKHILLVDDDTSVLSILVSALSDFHLTVARDPDEALAAAARVDALDLVITDYLMPSITGAELIARIREQRPQLKALIVTGHSAILDNEAPDWWIREPHLAKPFRVQALRDMVTALIGAASDVPAVSD